MGWLSNLIESAEQSLRELFGGTEATIRLDEGQFTGSIDIGSDKKSRTKVVVVALLGVAFIAGMAVK